MSSPEEFESRIKEMQLRHKEERNQLTSEYIKSFAAYPVGFSFTYEGKTHKILCRNIRPEWDEVISDPYETEYWTSEGSGCYPDQDIYYAIDDGVRREGRHGEGLLLAWRQDYLRKVMSNLGVAKEGSKA